MQVQVNATGDHKDNLDRWARTHLNEVLERFRDDITRIEVHLSDENGAKAGSSADKRCTLEARLANHQPVAVHHDAPNQDEAFRGATDKLKRLVESTVERARDQRHRERGSIRRDGTADPAADAT